jgi:crotonobetainyl-CoA:carnitine CoA-transferase CaiB-like acyl-CoA transferase
MRPLQGITVVSVEQAVAAPFATRQLADLGARVIKVERPDGGDFARGYDRTVGGLSSYFVWLNRTKESLALDLKRSEGARILSLLIGRADVFVQNLGPGAAARLGASTAQLRAGHPRLIVCSISGYGETGPFANRKAYDLLVQAEAGLISITGTADTPAKAGISVADIAAGMYAYSGVLTALYTRERNGRGASVEVSLFDALGEWMGSPAYYAAYGGSAPPRTGADHSSIAPYGPFRTRDGDLIVIGVQNAREWIRFCAGVLGSPGLSSDERFSTNPQRVKNRSALQIVIESVVGALPLAEVIQRLESADVAYARMNSMGEFLAHPQLAERDCWREIGSPSGPLRTLLPPVRLEGAVPAMGDVPSLGQHTDAILGELGIDGRTIAEWRKEGIV